MGHEEINQIIEDGIKSALAKPDIIILIKQAAHDDFDSAVTKALLPLQKRVAELERAIQQDRSDLNKLAKIVGSLEKLINELKTSTKEASVANKQVTDAVAELRTSTHEAKQNAAQSGRMNNLIVTGLIESDDENMRTEINQLMQDMDCTIGGDFSARRLGKKRDDGKPRLTLIQLSTVWDKRKIMASRTSLRNEDSLRKTVFINEDLTKEQSSLFYEARQARKAGQLTSAWTADCKIYVRPVGSPQGAQPTLIGRIGDLTSLIS